MAKTVAEIGRLVGCSGATVSRALNNSGAVSAKTREAIFEALRNTDYPVHRNGRVGRPPNRQRSAGMVEILFCRDVPFERIAVDHGRLLVPQSDCPGSEMLSLPRDLATSFYRQIVDGMVGELEEWEKRAVLKIAGDLTSPDLLSEINGPERTGVLVIGYYPTGLERFLSQCVHPVVLVDLIHHGRSDAVTTDNHAGIGLAFGHLYELGHRRIGFIGRFDSNPAFAERFSSFKTKMADVGLPALPEWIYEGPNRIDQTEASVSAMLKSSERPSAFVCVNDCVALGVIRAAAAQGIRIPRDLSVVGFDDQEVAGLVTPALTTVRIPMTEIGRQSVRQLMIEIQHPRPTRRLGCTVRLAPELVVRQSTAVCNTGNKGAGKS